MQPLLSFKEIIKESWIIVKKNYGLLLGTFALAFVVQIVLNILQKYGPTNFVFTLLLLIASVFLQTVVAIGMTMIGLKLTRGQSAQVSDVYSHTEPFLRYFLTSVVRSLIILGGLILLIIPGIVWGIKYVFSLIAVVDKDIKMKDALKLSAAMTKGNKWKLFGMGFGFLGFNILGALALGVGLLVTIPISFISGFVIYEKLRKHAEKDHPTEVTAEPVLQ